MTQRSPIERMADEACGLDGRMSTDAQIVSLSKEADALQRVAQAAIRWARLRRLGLPARQQVEQELERSVKKLVELGWKEE